ncbi:hypothetical protein ACKKK1_000033 [Escherichia coli]|uniref:hypothetical protein n=1 Tax=Escherichia coli TaxID=562 RepID=UPI000CE8592A|nr:hypothetical protein [Escherichia coli]EEW1661808.1 hypothetical protein [Escherichia coli]EFH5076262.1 hypothetical protein [Escherichia coli]EFH6237714.1 hypothetical protein [Escherichia coli]EFM0294508.1 hypothetical protein [Escherichia coli]EFN4412969.1 hypothetical protein [Escherichia coli]
MSFFTSEKAMQIWLEDKLEIVDGLAEIIDNVQEIEDYIPKNISEVKIKKSYLHCLKSLYLHESLTKDENISSTKGDSLRPDILAYASETESLVIIELKNQGGATREAGTELSAYASEIKSSLSYLSDGDIVNVLISPSWPPLLKHHIYNNVFWQGKNTICLEPIKKNNEILLKIVDIPLFVQAELPTKISEEHLGGYHVCLYDNSQYLKERPETKLHQYLPLIKTSISSMATTGEKMNTHGFAFLRSGTCLSPYFITLVNAAPFKSIERILHSNDIESYNDLPLIEKKILDVYLEYSPEGHGFSLDSLYNSGTHLLQNVCSPAPEGFTSWSEMKEEIMNSHKIIYFESWGIFKEIAISKLSEKYKNGEFDIDLNNINLGLEVINEIIDKDYQFINPQYLHDSFFPENHPTRNRSIFFDQDVIDDFDDESPQDHLF